MRVGQTYSAPPPQAIRAAVPAPAREPLKPASPSLDSDSVSGIGTAAADNRAAKVEELRNAVQSGTYKVDTAEVSSKIVDQHLER